MPGGNMIANPAHLRQSNLLAWSQSWQNSTRVRKHFATSKRLPIPSRFQRKGLGYSKDLELHRHATALFLGVYNFVRKHKTLGTSPAVAAGVEFERWDLERVVEMTAEYCRRKEDAVFEEAFAEALGC